MAEECDKFYADLREAINNVSTNGMNIVISDVNARVGQNRQRKTTTTSVGPFTVDVENENESKLIDFFELNNMITTNTFFNHKVIHQTSWMHSRSKKWHMIDFTIVNKKFRSSLEGVRMFRRAPSIIGTDHHLMRVKIKMHLRNRRKHVNMKKMNVGSTMLKDDKLLEAFQKVLSDIFDDARSNTMNIDGRYNLFLSQIKEKAKRHFAHDKNTNRKRKEWLTTDILKALDEKSRALLEWQNHRGCTSEFKYPRKYKRLRKIVKTMAKQRQLEYWDAVCEDIEMSMKNNDPTTAFSIIRCLKGGSKRVENMPVHDKSGKLLVNSKDALKR